MNNNSSSLSKTLLISACIILDIAVITGFFIHFSLFSSMDSGVSSLILTVMLVSLGFINYTVIGQENLGQKFGIAYSASFITLSVLYTLAANFLSFLFFSKDAGSPEDMVWQYVIWELIILAVMIGICSLTARFASRNGAQIDAVQIEQTARNAIAFQLLAVEALVSDPEIRIRFAAMKDRINASTPFGRIRDNQAVFQMEGLISSNLSAIKTNLEQGLGDENNLNIAKLIDDTLTLVINRERLIIK